MTMPLPMPILFGIMHRLRPLLINWLEPFATGSSELQQNKELSSVLDAVYSSALGVDQEPRQWCRLEVPTGTLDDMNSGRYARLQAGASVPPQGCVREDPTEVTAEINLQVFQYAAAGAVLRPLPRHVSRHAELAEALGDKQVIGLVGALQEQHKHMSLYKIDTGKSTYHVESWGADELMSEVGELNDKEIEKIKNLLNRGGADPSAGYEVDGGPQSLPWPVGEMLWMEPLKGFARNIDDIKEEASPQGLGL
jgi:hypothetical protein